MRFNHVVLTLAAAAMLGAPTIALAKPPPPKKQTSRAREHVLTAKQDRIKQLHDQAIKWKLGLPRFTFGHGYSTLSTKFTPEFRVSPPVDGWVTDYGEADGSAYRIRLSLINWGTEEGKRSLYTDAQKIEVFKNLVGHLYKLAGADLDKVVKSPEGQALQGEFASKIDDGGFDFPMKLTIKG